MKTIVVKTKEETRVIRVKLLLAVEVNDYVCRFHIKDEPSFSCTDSLSKIQTELPDYFFRISRFCIINVQYVQSIDSKRREVKLAGNLIFRFSVRNAHELKRLFSQ